MVDVALFPALKRALRENEIGNASPYMLSYARKGRSGASFGVFQADTNVQPDARVTLRQALVAAGATQDMMQRIIDALSQPLPDGSPLQPQDEQFANNALASPAGRALVDQMDDRTFGIIGRELDSAVGAARGNGRTIDPVAQIAIGLWVNMTGAPTALNTWLGGNAIGGLAPPHGPRVTRGDISNYLHNTQYFRINPRNFVHFTDSVDSGARLLPAPDAPAPPGFAEVAIVAAPPAGPVAGNDWLYAQRSGNMFHRVGAATTFLAKGYSGRGNGENNPDLQFERDIGPLPRGTYTIEAPVPFNAMRDCLPLLPDPGNDMGGRSGFLIHDGAYTGRPHGNTSHGCICLVQAARLTMWQSGDHRLVVVSDDPM